MTNELEKYLTVPEVAEHFRCTVWTTRKWLREGVFPNARKIGKNWLVPVGDVAVQANNLYGGKDEG